MSINALKKMLVKLLSSDKEIKFSMDTLVRGLSGVKHKVDIYISHPCNLAVMIPCGDLKVELIKAVVIGIDIRVPVVLLINEEELMKYEKDFLDILEEVPVKIILYRKPSEEYSKLYQEIIRECKS
ncbi:MAG: hypothetical protein B6U75_00230 [Desulfurococcales archaeon ex4484_217_1]|nr:MAG: hypothetical protein B6U75_00230 [Desulfurococcales archaeon ex4484_217_1]